MRLRLRKKKKSMSYMKVDFLHANLCPPLLIDYFFPESPQTSPNKRVSINLTRI
jgi:hypothetical protein